MPNLGQTLQAARQAKKVTASQAAAATRIKIQHIEALERNDFSKMAAPMYAKGFLRMYAEYLGLDPAPLIQEYNDLHAPKERVPLIPEDAAAKPKKGEAHLPRWWEKVEWSRVPTFLDKWKRPLLAGAGALAVLFLLALGVGKCVQRAADRPPVEAGLAEKPRPVLPLVREPAEPYIEDTAVSAQKP